MMETNKDNKNLTKMEITQQFSKLFEDQANSNCFQCGKKSRQWAQTKQAIFLCLSCAANYKEISRVTNVKSISLDIWSQQEMELLRIGGNKRFKDLLQKYQFENSDPTIILKTQAAEYYRKLIQAEVNKTESPAQPSIQEGKKPFVQEIPLTEMTSDQLIHEAKQRLSWAGTQSKIYGKKAYDKVHHKVTSGQLKQDAKKAGEKVSQTAKSIWAFVSTKIDEIKKKDDKKKEDAPEL